MTQAPPPRFRRYGPDPTRVAILHGGPGAPGEVAPVARELAASHGILEPFQTAYSIVGQIQELADCLTAEATPPVSLIGYSWGAWLALLLAAEHPTLVSRLILVASGPLEERFVPSILETRLRRLPPKESREVRTLLAAESNLDDAGLARLGHLMTRADAFDPDPLQTPEPSPIPAQAAMYTSIWPEAAALRRSGTLLRKAADVRCPILVIHGEADPHPVAGVWEPLSRCAAGCVRVILPHCGHVPWKERQARDLFFRTLQTALNR